MNPFDSIGKFFVGLIHEGHLQAWIKLGVSCAITIFVTFFGTFSLIGLSLLSQSKDYTFIIIFALFTAILHMSLAVLNLWLKSPLTKGIPILYFGSVEAKRIELLTQDSTVYTDNIKR